MRNFSKLAWWSFYRKDAKAWFFPLKWLHPPEYLQI